VGRIRLNSSRYVRTAIDLPSAGISVRLQITVRI